MYFDTQAYCPKCEIIVKEPIKHTCGTKRFIVVTEETLEVVSMLIALGYDIHRAISYADPQHRSDRLEYTLVIAIGFTIPYPKELFEGVPTGWIYDAPILTHTKTGCWSSYEEMYSQIKKTVATFTQYLATYDPQATKSVLTLMYKVVKDLTTNKTWL